MYKNFSFFIVIFSFFIIQHKHYQRCVRNISSHLFQSLMLFSFNSTNTLNIHKLLSYTKNFTQNKISLAKSIHNLIVKKYYYT